MSIPCSDCAKVSTKMIYGKLRQDVGKILRQLCDFKHVEIIEAHAMPDHIHMLVSIPPKLAVSDFMGYLKGKSTLIIFERYANMKYKYGRRVFWSKGYYECYIFGKQTAFDFAAVKWPPRECWPRYTPLPCGTRRQT